jgi:sugar diacid utilization regulator
MSERLPEGSQCIIYKSKVFFINLVYGSAKEIVKEMLEVVRHIVYILKDQKAPVDQHHVAKRVRNEFVKDLTEGATSLGEM